MSIRQRIQNLERRVGLSANSGVQRISDEEIHAAMGRVLTNSIAHEAASRLGTIASDAGVLDDPGAFRAMARDDDEVRDEVLHIYNTIADLR